MPEQTALTRLASLASRPLTWSIVACTAVCLLVPRPGFGDPGNNTVPDSGALPVASAPLQLPGGTSSAPVTTPVAGPLGTRIMAESAAVEALGEQLKQAQIDAAAAHDATVATQLAWTQADAKAKDLRERANNAAAEAYKKAESLGPLSQYASTVHQLGVLAPGFSKDTPGGVAGSQTALLDAARAEQAAANAYTAYQSAQATEKQLTGTRDQLNTTYNQRSAALVALRSNNTAAVAQAEAAQEATDQRLAGSFAAGTNVDGKVANPIALKAVAFAISQLGAQYHFGAEGPYNVGYDCSGLVWASYRAAKGPTIPRVAKDQYHATSIVDVTKLLPGDLVFFSTSSTSDWTTISHVGIYVGDNRMVEAPHTGATVRIRTIWWSAFFGATRVVPAVDAPVTHTPSPTPSHTQGPSTPPSSKPPSNPPSSGPPSSAPPSSAPPSTPPSSAAASAAPASDPPASPAAPQSQAAVTPSSVQSKAAPQVSTSSS
jgi:cell wall-associated NlpC family hydrolase